MTTTSGTSRVTPTWAMAYRDSRGDWRLSPHAMSERAASAHADRLVERGATQVLAFDLETLVRTLTRETSSEV